MSNLLGLDDGITADIRLNGIGWIGAILVVGVSILAARLVVHWQLRRVEKILAGKDQAAAEEGKGPGGQRESAER
jgi:hypothetical protein